MSILLCIPQIFSGNAAAAMATLGAAKACGVVGMLAVVASMFKPQWAPYTAPTYALCKGVAMAAMSAVLEMSYPGVWCAMTVELLGVVWWFVVIIRGSNHVGCCLRRE